MMPFRKPDCESAFYDRRLKIFIGLNLALFLVCLARLLQMQLLANDDSLQGEIAALKERRGFSRQLKTLRGKITDRHGEILAADVPQFRIYLGYQLSCYRDERVVQAKKAAARRESANRGPVDVNEEVENRRQELQDVIDKCTEFGFSREEIEARIQAMNDDLWDLRSFVCWARGNHDPNLVAEYGRINDVPQAEAMADFEQRYSDPDKRNRQVMKVDDLPEMEKFLPLVELQSQDDVFAAQLGLMGMDEVRILPTGRRSYPYGSVAAQTIGWVGLASQKHDTRLFAGDPLANYLADEVCGREDGVEYVCESILRGRRGEQVYDIDRQLVRETETQYGADVQLTLDIRLQKQLEERLRDPNVNPDYCKAPMAAVVLAVRSGDILALVSLPNYDLNRGRYDYNDLRHDPGRPLTNRALNRLYPPGSVVKPLVLIAGLESGVIRPEESISCPSARAPAGWPNCLIYTKSKVGHDVSWINNARNAMKGSCNIYFSRLADRIDARVLQQWFFQFGCGREAPLACPAPPVPGSIPRRFKQAAGQIGSTLVYTDIESLDQIPPLTRRDKIQFGIGHGNFRVTPLQVANAFAALARGGQFKPARLFLDPSTPAPPPVDLQISPATLRVVYDGMSAVVNEHGGTAYDAFRTSGLARKGVKVYGKTGSTEKPDNAWFAGFVEDREGARLAVALVIEGGLHGGSDAGPLARDIIECCVEAGYAGNQAATTPAR